MQQVNKSLTLARCTQADADSDTDTDTDADTDTDTDADADADTDTDTHTQTHRHTDTDTDDDGDGDGWRAIKATRDSQIRAMTNMEIAKVKEGFLTRRSIEEFPRSPD